MRSPKKPTAQKKLEGTQRKDRANAAEPQYEARLPDPPDWLCPRAVEAWHFYGGEMNGQRTMAGAYTAVLAAFCESVAEVAELTAKMGAGEEFLQDEDGKARKYPIRKERREAIARMQSLAADLGLSPASVGKVSSIGQPPETDPLERLLRDKQARETARTAKPARERVM